MAKDNVTLDKSKFEYVQLDEVIYDEQIESEPIGYFKDAWIRFRKNRVSVVAFVILITLMILAVIGPYFNEYTYDDYDNRLQYLPPRVPVLEDYGIFDGTKVLRDRNVTPFFNPNLPDGTVIEMTNEYTKFKCDGNIDNQGTDTIDPINEGDKCINSNGQSIPFKQTTLADVKVDYYLYKGFINTYGENMYLTLTPEQYEKVDKNIIISEETKEQQMVRYIALNSEGVETEYVKAKEKFDQEVDMSTVIGDPEYFADILHNVNVDYYQYIGFEEGEMPYFWLGTDDKGKDLFTMIWLGARTSFMVAFSVAFINIFIGIFVGAISGYYGGTLDLIVQRILEIVSSVPFLAVITLLVLRFGSPLWVVILAFTITRWIPVSRVVRAQFFRYKGREYVLAARSLGASDARIMARHIFPNGVGTIITRTVLMIPVVIFTEANFSFLGIINYQSMTSVGRIVSVGQTEMDHSFHLLLFPSIFISLLMLSFNMFGNGLRDAFNPSLRGVEE
ncbi:ABC transporter permease [Haloplasma contractile]|uniref:Oligopeptide transport system permease protein n=1 Tax=Haloplasma contractile SSD-17B TaxID=1033810 RepID=U2DXZ8_9MOLU|nr:ABC transporter permease [Haloplasma contractile]ERJ13137.1 Oligopeptide transport system permease protein [Haloplasma contractile SSD-17B]